MSEAEPDLFRGELGQRVRRLVLEMVGDEGYDHVTVRDMAMRLGVGPEEMYRRWPSKPDLLVQAAYSFLSGIPVPDTGDVREDLIGFTTGVTRLVGGELRPLQHAVVSRLKRAPDVAAAYAVISTYLQETLEKIIRRGVSRGQLLDDAQVGLAVEILRARWSFRLILDLPMDERVAEESIDRVVIPVLNYRC